MSKRVTICTSVSLLIACSLVSCSDDTGPSTAGDYSEDFTAGPAGAEWGGSSVTTSPSGERFLGTWSTGDVTLTLTDLPEHDEVVVEFDLYVIGSWNGHGEPATGIDAMTFSTGDGVLLATTFSNGPEDVQAYPGAYPGTSNAALSGASGAANLGYVNDDGEDDDARYRVSFTIPHTGSSLEFTAAGETTSAQELWGLDNVRVTAR